MSDKKEPSSLAARLPLSKFDILDSCFTCSEQEKNSKDKLNKLTEAFKTVIECVGEDPDREGLLKTPVRAAKALCFFTKGYEQTVKGQFNSWHFEVLWCVFGTKKKREKESKKRLGGRGVVTPTLLAELVVTSSYDIIGSPWKKCRVRVWNTCGFNEIKENCIN